MLFDEFMPFFIFGSSYGSKGQIRYPTSAMFVSLDREVCNSLFPLYLLVFLRVNPNLKFIMVKYLDLRKHRNSIKVESMDRPGRRASRASQTGLIQIQDPGSQDQSGPASINPIFILGFDNFS